MFTVIFDCKLNDELLSEGFARELVNKINTMRRSAQLHVSDRIHCVMGAPDVIQSAFLEHQAYICEETLISSYHLTSEQNQGDLWDINGYSVSIAITVV